MANNKLLQQASLSYFHACVHCGSRFPRDAFDNRSIYSGIYPCFQCGQEGPLNIVIEEMQKLLQRQQSPSSN